MEFTLQGQKYELQKKCVESNAKDLEPKRIAKYAVEISGKIFPINQIVAAATGLPIIAIHTADAYRVLTKLGYVIQENGKSEKHTFKGS